MTKNTNYARPDGDRTAGARHRTIERKQAQALKNQARA